MALFSQRKGIRPAQKALQRESIDNELRNRLWSGVKIFVWDNWSPKERLGYQTEGAKKVELFLKRLWLHHLKRPLDTLPDFERAYSAVRDLFFESQWWAVYDFLEFTIGDVPSAWSQHLIEFTNQMLTEENAAYRISGSHIVEITDENELGAIDQASSVDFAEVREHLGRSLVLLTDRKAPDYRNCIKEAISAVESICQRVAAKQGATLGDCLKALKARCPIHPAFESGLSKLYGFTSDAGGIRHALTEESVAPTFADAKFMLVAASAFVNFLIARSAEVGLKLIP